MIGGAELYQSAMQIADKLYVTEVELSVQGDAFFAEIEADVWQETSREVHVSSAGVAFAYVSYERKA